jgi:hypothetical protein
LAISSSESLYTSYLYTASRPENGVARYTDTKIVHVINLGLHSPTFLPAERNNYKYRTAVSLPLG